MPAYLQAPLLRPLLIASAPACLPTYCCGLSLLSPACLLAHCCNSHPPPCPPPQLSPTSQTAAAAPTQLPTSLPTAAAAAVAAGPQWAMRWEPGIGRGKGQVGPLLGELGSRKPPHRQSSAPIQKPLTLLLFLVADNKLQSYGEERRERYGENAIRENMCYLSVGLEAVPWECYNV